MEPACRSVIETISSAANRQGQPVAVLMMDAVLTAFFLKNQGLMPYAYLLTDPLIYTCCA